MVPGVFREVGDVDGQGRHRDHPRIDGRGKIRCPTAFRSAGDEEVPDVRQALLDRVHRANNRLRHGHMNRPLEVTGHEVLVQAVGKYLVFRPGVVHFIGEKQRLVRHLVQLSIRAAIEEADRRQV